MVKALTQSDLDAMALSGCQLPGCDHSHGGEIYLHGKCHLGGRLEVRYVAFSGMLEVNCRECGRPVAVIKVGT